MSPENPWQPSELAGSWKRNPVSAVAHPSLGPTVPPASLIPHQEVTPGLSSQPTFCKHHPPVRHTHPFLHPDLHFQHVLDSCSLHRTCLIPGTQIPLSERQSPHASDGNKFTVARKLLGLEVVWPLEMFRSEKGDPNHSPAVTSAVGPGAAPHHQT